VSHQLVGNSAKIEKVVSMIQKVAPTDSNVLIYGESGTGKELVARAVHANSLRKDRVFFAVDCGTLSGDLLENELFGHAKGAFTDAHQEKKGIFTQADKGTVFLDEIANVDVEVQGKLLRFLESREFLPLGYTKPVQVDVRLIFATNKNLHDMVLEGTFREDFYYRIFVYPIMLPPLRERREDVLPIAYHFLEQFNRKMNKSIEGFERETANRMTNFQWPGNVRQLRNAVERAAILCDGRQITMSELPVLSEIEEIEHLIEHVPANNEELKKIKKEIRRKAVAQVERNFIRNALARNDWNVTQAAKTVGLQRTNFHNLMKKHNITLPKIK
jgi:transcriptional regulator with GAF, ATPase, and Fis domain